MAKFKIYVASSWRNNDQPEVVVRLRLAGHEVYDFKNPEPGNHGFHWSEIDTEWKMWSMWTYRDALNHPIAESGYQRDFAAMQWANILVAVQPFGRSAAQEMGWACGKGKHVILLLAPGQEPELMVKMCNKICTSIEEVLTYISSLEAQAKPTGSDLLPEELRLTAAEIMSGEFQ